MTEQGLVETMPSSGAPAPTFWFSVDGSPVPAEISRIIGPLPQARLPVEAPGICLFAAEQMQDAATIRTLRNALGKDTYLVGLFAGDASVAMRSAAIRDGLDDVLQRDRLGEWEMVTTRGHRMLAERRRTRSFRDTYQIERDYLQACIDNLPAPIFFKNEQGIYVGCNKAFEDYIGRSSADIIGKSVYEIAPRELADRYREADEALMAEGGVQVYEAKVRYADGTHHDVSFHKAVITDNSGRPRGLAGAMLDITERKALESDLKVAAERDPLTNLFNRRKFFDACHARIAEAGGAGAGPLSVAVIDIDRFKAINDRYGHAIGDEVLCAVARQMEQFLEGDGIIARAGGEEFYAMLPGLTADAASRKLEALRHRIASLAIPAAAASVSVTISIGVADVDPTLEKLSDSLNRADRALYGAKHDGRNRLVQAA
ncbi:sensor domain-containing diguanylate cyclase [Rhizobium halophytocola]|uniref:Diguanylate cyclase (GGDEF)-like protein/PAS domain S-box-containing protein n=1 Tax=Rhizobium halophytocola TaxID=735519 RepID=A0ABS4DYP3_9HYPH|nr:GGDEF domain-containing protein [Rhizobium halophytocola]MBP1850809.1 diguanylate cyclase (GGDEF)-like protein/PAS domain S-box-containing protein [Rhizobium halophytocola]